MINSFSCFSLSSYCLSDEVILLTFISCIFYEGHTIKCRSRTYGRWSNADGMTWMLLTIKLSNVSHDFSLSPRLSLIIFPSYFPLSFLISLFLSDHLLVDDDPPGLSLFLTVLSRFSSYHLQISSLILCFSLFSYVSSLLILMMIVIKSIWWCPPLLSSARWWCFMSVLSLWSDYRGWLLIIFILNILL